MEVKMIIKENSVFGILKDIGITRIVIKEGNKSVTVVKDPLVWDSSDFLLFYKNLIYSCNKIYKIHLLFDSKTRFGYLMAGVVSLYIEKDFPGDTS